MQKLVDSDSRGVSRVNSPVTVVLCTHNGDRFLPAQLASVVAQTALPGEIIISDDASTDDTRALLDDFSRQSPIPVTILRNDPGLGYRDNFIQAVGAATLPWVAFCDQDDLWHPTKLERCGSALEDPGVTQVVHTATLVDEYDRPIGTYDQGIKGDAVRPPLYYDVWKTFSGFSMVVRRRMFEVVGADRRFPPHEEPGQSVLAHDRWAFFLAQTLGKTVEIADPLVSYRQHSSNVYGGAPRTLVSKLRQLRDQRAEVPVAQGRLVDEAEAMLGVVRGLAGLAQDTAFPLFDPARAEAFYAGVLRRTSVRAALYREPPARGLSRVAAGVADDLYRTKNGGARNWDSVLKDAAYLAVPRSWRESR